MQTTYTITKTAKYVIASWDDNKTAYYEMAERMNGTVGLTTEDLYIANAEVQAALAATWADGVERIVVVGQPIAAGEADAASESTAKITKMMAFGE